jgi:hypothetical protein
MVMVFFCKKMIISVCPIQENLQAAEHVNTMIFAYNLFPLERLLLAMVG